MKTAVSEAVTNAIIHGYEDREGQVYLSCEISGDTATIIVEDKGVGMRDVKQALQPFYTTKPDLERSGMGFALWRHLWMTWKWNLSLAMGQK